MPKSTPSPCSFSSLLPIHSFSYLCLNLLIHLSMHALIPSFLHSLTVLFVFLHLFIPCVSLWVLEKEMATPLITLAWRIPYSRGSLWLQPEFLANREDI